MGFISRLGDSRFGKTMRWITLTAALTSGAGIGQNALSYISSRDATRDMVQITQTSADSPEIAHMDWQLRETMAKTTEQAKPGAETTVNKENVGTAKEDIELKIPESTVQKFISSMYQDENLGGVVNETVQKADQQVENRLEKPNTISGSLLAGVRAPLPTGEEAILHMAVPNLGTRDFYKAPLDMSNWTNINPTGTSLGSVVEESIPLSVNYEINQQAPDVKVETVLFTPETLPAPPDQNQSYVFLTAADTMVTAQNPNLGISGKVDIELDLDGKVVDQKISILSEQALNGKTESERMEATGQILQLRNRKIEAQQLKGRTEKAGITETLQKVVDSQDKEFSMNVTLPTDQPLAGARSYFWLGPDRDNDGIADIYVTQELDTSGMENIQLGDLNLSSTNEIRSSNRLLNWGAEKLENAVNSQMDQALKNMEGQLKGMVREGVKKASQNALPGVEKIVNESFVNYFNEHGNISQTLEKEGFHKQLDVKMMGIKVVEQDGQNHAVIRLDMGDANLDAGKSGFVQHLNECREAAEAGKVLVTTDGQNINQMLRDQKEGGAVDWEQMLNSNLKDTPVLKIEFNRDKDGNTVYPRIIMENGKPVIDLDITAHLQGKGILEGAGDVLKGGSGLMDSGVKAITDGTVGQLGDVGKAVGGVVRAPFWLVDQLVGGAKEVVDGTVGKVVDAIPKAATESKIRVNVQVPVSVTAKEGVIQVQANPKGIEISDAKFKSDVKAEELIPTRALASVLVHLVAAAADDGVVPQDKPLASQQIDLQQKGIDFQEVQFREGIKDKYGDTIPVIKIQVSPNQNISNTVSQMVRNGQG